MLAILYGGGLRRAELCGLDLADFEAGTKVAGQKFYFLKNEAALLEIALVQYAIQAAVKAGYTPIITPDLARVEVLEGIGFLVAIDRVLDMMRTMTNVTGQMLVPVLVARQTGLLDREVYERGSGEVGVEPESGEVA